MLRWCSYCQKFMGESADYGDFNITHGICGECKPIVFALTGLDLTNANSLQDIHNQLFEAGQRNDLKAAERIIEDAAKANVRAVDILIGIIAPMLYQIGEDWKRGIVTVADEHHFTSFCEKTFELVTTKVKFMAPATATEEDQAKVLLMNAPGNRHTLAIRFLALCLVDKGIRARIVEMSASLEELVALVYSTKPRFLLVSMALAEHRMSVIAIAERIAELPRQIRPKVIVGGYAVKVGLVSAIPGADLMADISLL